MLIDKTLPQSAISFDAAVVTTKGSRDYQEDSVLLNFAMGQSHGFAVLADGMGGQEAGEIASALAVGEVFARLKMRESLLESDGASVTDLLAEAAGAANARIGAHVAANPDARGMGCTLLVPVVVRDRLAWISVGDSPLFLLRGGNIHRLNQDHSMGPQIDMMVRAGALDRAAAENHPDRHVLTSALTGGKVARIDCPPAAVPLQPGDILIAASDGLLTLSQEEIAGIAGRARPDGASSVAAALLAAIAAADDPDQDNAAVAVILIATPEAVAMPEDASSPERQGRKERRRFFYRGQAYARLA